MVWTTARFSPPRVMTVRRPPPAPPLPPPPSGRKIKASSSSFPPCGSNRTLPGLNPTESGNQIGGGNIFLSASLPANNAGPSKFGIRRYEPTLVQNSSGCDTDQAWRDSYDFRLSVSSDDDVGMMESGTEHVEEERRWTAYSDMFDDDVESDAGRWSRRKTDDDGVETVETRTTLRRRGSRPRSAEAARRSDGEVVGKRRRRRKTEEGPPLREEAGRVRRAEDIIGAGQCGCDAGEAEMEGKRGKTIGARKAPARWMKSHARSKCVAKRSRRDGRRLERGGED